jgi:hypothetical protein
MSRGSDVEVILGKAPPPGAKRPMPDGKGADPEGGDDDYDAKLDTMQAFMDAVKGDDPKATLDAWEDVKANC